MKILLVGARSSLALAVKPLLSEFAEVVTAGRNGCDVILDLSSPELSLGIAPDYDVVINTAAHFGGNRVEDMIEAENINALGILRLCQACTKVQVGKLVQVSSIFATLSPSSPFYSVYALSKKHAEEAANIYSASFGLPLLIIRPSQIYGVGETYRKKQPFLYSIIDKAQKNQDVVIYGSNDAFRNYIHVEDVAIAIALAVRSKLIGTYDCVHMENVRYSHVANAAIAAFGSTSRVLFASDKPDIPDNAFVMDDSLYRAIDYFPQISIISGMQKEAEHRKTRS